MKLQYIILAGFMAASTGVDAKEELSKEITIEKEIVPEQRAATRLNVTPAVSLPAVKTKRLTYSDRSVSTSVPASISTLEPAAYGTTTGAENYRGYVDLGYFPTFNAALSAGYRIVDNEKTLLRGWMQYDGTVYDGNMADGEDVTLRSHTVTAGLGLVQHVGGASTVNVDADYTFSRFNMPVEEEYYQNVNRVNIDAAWKSTVRGIDYTIGLGYGHFGYGKSGLEYFNSTLKPARENRIAVNAGAAVQVGEHSHVSLDADVSHLGYNENDNNSTLISLTPSYLYRLSHIVTRIGAKIEVTTNMHSGFHIAPDMGIDWMPSSLVAVYCRLSGGEHQNTLGSLYDFTRYAEPLGLAISGNSNIPYALDAGLNVGSWKGLSFRLFGGYAVADNWLMPYAGEVNGFCRFGYVDIKGWHAGAAVKYEYRNLAEIDVSYETAPQKHDKGYYLWRDRSRYVVDASLTVHPIDRLDVTVGYELRAKRKMTSGVENILPDINLGNMENLSLGGLYRINQNLSVFARLENILDNKCMLVNDIPAQGFTGLVGVGYKF